MDNEKNAVETQVTKEKKTRTVTKKTAKKPEPVKAPEKKAETKAAQANEAKAKNVEGLLELNRLAWRVLHQLNAAIIGDSERDLIQ